MHTLENVEAQLQKFCEDKIAQAVGIDKRYTELWREIDAYIKGGGKRMRPRLVLLAYDAYRSNDNTDITPVAAAWELLHACLLVHDDIIDRDLIRHGKPNIAGRYQSIYGSLGATDNSHYALSAALLGGDLLLMSAYEMIMSADAANDTKLLALSYINQALFAVAGGELIDTDSVLYPVEKSSPLAVATHKTASYSLQLPLQCGAALAGAPKEELEKLHTIGLHAGIAFQLQDDLLGVFGDSAITGKSNRSDILEKKRTFLLHKALELLAETDANRLRELYAPSHAVTHDEAEEIVRLLASSGAKEQTEQMIATEIAEALSVISTLSISDIYRSQFTAIAEKLIARTS